MQCSGSFFSPRLNIYTLSLFLFIPVLIFLLPSQTDADTPKNDPPEWSGEQKAPDQPETNDREWRYIQTQSLLLQLLATEGQAVDLGPFSEPSYEIMLGWKWAMKPKLVFELGLIENIITFDNSPDFGIHAGITSRF